MLAVKELIKCIRWKIEMKVFKAFWAFGVERWDLTTTLRLQKVSCAIKKIIDRIIIFENPKIWEVWNVRKQIWITICLCLNHFST